LKFGGQILHDNKTIHQENIVADTTLTIDFHNLKIEIDLPSGKTYEISVDPTDPCTIIQDQITQKEGIEKTKYNLFHNDVLLDVSQTVKSAGLREGETIVMMYKQVKINVADKVKGNTSFDFDPMETVQTIKDKL
jgi:hypothetical protein